MSPERNSELYQYLTFTLDEETFAIDIAKVREVLDFSSVTRVPQTPDYMRGVINLRGAVVPVVDMRLKFGMPAAERTVNSCILIVEIDTDGETAVIGALADSVEEVIDLAPEQIEPAPRIGAALDTDFIRGMSRQGERFVILLHIDRAFSSEELAAVGRQGSPEPLAEEVRARA